MSYPLDLDAVFEHILQRNLLQVPSSQDSFQQCRYAFGVVPTIFDPYLFETAGVLTREKVGFQRLASFLSNFILYDDDRPKIFPFCEAI